MDRGEGPFSLEELQSLLRITTYRTADEALAVKGWKQLPPGVGPRPQGAYGYVKLVCKQLPDQEQGRRVLRVNCLAAAKLQLTDHLRHAWREANIMRACSHENIVTMYDMFVVVPSADDRDRHGYQRPATIWLLMEYASAGDLVLEMERYTDDRIPESGVRYYSLDIADGLRYLHSRNIAHNDLHVGNVVLKYRPDCSKVAMLCDFGLSIIFNASDQPDVRGAYQHDIARYCLLIATMLGPVSPSADASLQMIYYIGSTARSYYGAAPKTVDEVLQFDWFTIGPAIAPHPDKGPTPLLKTPDVHAIGYLRQDTPTGLPPSSSMLNRTRKGLRNLGRRVSAAVQAVRHRTRSPSESAAVTGAAGGGRSSGQATAPVSQQVTEEQAPAMTTAAAAAATGQRSTGGHWSRIASRMAWKRQ